MDILLWCKILQYVIILLIGFNLLRRNVFISFILLVVA